MNCREGGLPDVKTSFFGFVPIFSGKNSSCTNVKALREQFGPTLSEKGRLCKKVEDPCSIEYRLIHLGF